MTEQELLQKLNTCDRQIASSYRDLQKAARSLSKKGCDAASAAQVRAVQAVRDSKSKWIYIPIWISLLGFLLTPFVGIITLIIGIYAYSGRKKTVESAAEQVRREHETMISAANTRRNALETVLQNHATI